MLECGRYRAKTEPDFVDFIISFDFCLVETFASSTFDFSVYFSDFLVFHVLAKKLSYQGRGSGGVALLVRKTVSRYVSKIEVNIDNTVAVKIAGTLLSSVQDIILVCTYIPPPTSPYYKDKAINSNIPIVGQWLLDLQDIHRNCQVILCGDFNARTGQWQNTTDDDTLDDSVWRDPETDDGRCSQNTVINQFGRLFIELCSTVSLWVVSEW
ncbi:hypothetical protein BaRGS_00032081 [Batillaria attramentaria]|uniref:Endonuclease/exonuclease/phosphatase domain-containing protein n=1 Tax=Batillaria attramentaria TaxID=370345 RepID=A0ABD0JPR7_9CAEN